mmetsp:Transcript_40247/g.105685  ORF Transcript_40247/g.105685 Transcript_40247/m.105685 type:complete len:655 (+) Transcript_40247:43-2007(+)
MAPKAKAKEAPAAAEPKQPEPGDEMGGDDYDMPVIIKITPDDQLELEQEELDKEVPPRILYPNNPQAAHNITKFSFKEKAWKRDDQVDHTVFHFSLDGAILLKDSPEAVEQEEILKRKKEETTKREKAQEVDIDIEPPQQDDEIPAPNTLRNQFNFSERACQTFKSVTRERGVSTEPPPTTEFCDTVTQWCIFDTYMADIDAAKQGSETKKRELGEDKKKKNDSDPLYSDSMKLSIKIMERMVNLNAENEIYTDFKYWEDRSDDYRDGDGTLLPLWRFASEKAKRKQVTCIRWNPKYKDLFAVGFGSYDFMRQSGGVICCYSLKNTRHPEYLYTADCGVCCLDWHPTQAAVLAVGLYDGTVVVHDVRAKTKKPIYSSTVRTNKHSDPVWEVRWNADDSLGTLNFFSISSDGRVSNWILMKNKLESEEVMELKLMSGVAADDDETSLTGLAGGLCFDFNKQSEHLFLVGTEEGKIHKCSKAFTGQYLETYEGHSMAVYTVRWNPFHPNIFISASADWTVKLWDHSQKTAVLSFDLAQSVGDVAWAPYSSTVFTAITNDGLVHCYDLNVNRNERICTQKVVKRAKLTHVAFNGDDPIILVGDDRGGVNCLKLSPNLRRPTEPPVDENGEPIAGKSALELQIAKMDHLLDMVKETVE